jgi:hypothetical protein
MLEKPLECDLCLARTQTRRCGLTIADHNGKMSRVFTNEDAQFLSHGSYFNLSCIFLESLGRDTCHFTRLAFWSAARDQQL